MEQSSTENVEKNEYENKMIEAFINNPEKTVWYQKSFKKYKVNGIEKIVWNWDWFKLAWNWNWWAFAVGPFFLFYRKAYLAGLVLLLLSGIFGGVSFIVSMLLSGGFSTYFVYKEYKKKKVETERTIDDTQKRLDTMRVIGGYNKWAIWAPVALISALLVFSTCDGLTTADERFGYEKDNSIKNSLMQPIEKMYNELYNKGLGKAYAERTASGFLVIFYENLHSKSFDKKECIKSTEKTLSQMNDGYMPMPPEGYPVLQQQLLLNKYCGNPDGLATWYKENMIDVWNDKHEIKIDLKDNALLNKITAIEEARKEKNAKQAEKFKELDAYHRNARTAADGGKPLTYAEQRKLEEAKNAEARQK